MLSQGLDLVFAGLITGEVVTVVHTELGLILFDAFINFLVNWDGFLLFFIIIVLLSFYFLIFKTSFYGCWTQVFHIHFILCLSPFAFLWLLFLSLLLMLFLL